MLLIIFIVVILTKKIMTLLHSITACLLLSLIATIKISAAKNITRGTTLTAGQATSSWPSPSGDFAFGFYPVNSSLFVLAIWFNITTPSAIVWTPNYSTPQLKTGSTLELTDDGNLSLKDNTGTEVWNPHIIQVSTAALLDSGNLVLLGDNPGDFLWQSFDSPTDTLLPGQIMLPGTNLLSRLAATNFSAGRFQLAVQNDGNLVLYPMAPLGGTHYDAYWASGTNDGLSNNLVYNTSGNLYLSFANGTLFDIFSSNIYSPENYYQRATLDVDGVFRKYIYPKTRSNSLQQTWTIVEHIPEDICSAITNDYGSGPCGYNSYCTLDDQGLVQCHCPAHYTFVDPAAQYKGCAPNFIAQSCDNDDRISSADQFTFVSMVGPNWPLNDYEHFPDVNEQQCMGSCLSDCFCAVFIFDSNGCWKKRLPLSNGRFQANSIALIKVRTSNASSNPTDDNDGFIVNKEKRNSWIIAVTSSGILNLIAIGFIVFLLIFYKKKIKKLKKRQEPENSMSEVNLRSFTYKEMDRATNGFSEEIGKGSFGKVYKGLLKSSMPKMIAVKKLVGLLKENEKEFLNEARTIGRTHHKNLVKLIGFCNEGTHRLLVYEYMSNGSLNNLLFSHVRPNWNQRVQIALDIARGLIYLHEECNAPIIHCDIKPQNVLLDENYVAKISDFGLAKLLKTDQTKSFVSIRGTRGYVAPEWFKGKIITKKVDVYSFGIMLLEIISCRKSSSHVTSEEEEIILADWAYDCYKDDMLEVLVGNEKEAMADFWRLKRFVMVAIWCIQDDPLLRPTMNKVMQMLEGSIEVSLPPDPLSI